MWTSAGSKESYINLIVRDVIQNKGIICVWEDLREFENVCDLAVTNKIS